MKQWLFRLSFKQRIWVSFAILTAAAVAVTGWASHAISSRIVEKNALQLRQDTINKSAQVLDEKLKKIVLSILSLKMSDPYQDMLRDTTSGDASHYYARLTALQPMLAQLKFIDNFIQSILITTPIGDFYPTTYSRLSENAFRDTEMYRQAKALNRSVWMPGHEDALFYGREQVISLVVDGSGSQYLSDVYIVVNIKVRDLQNLIDSEISHSKGYYLIDRNGDDVLGDGSALPGNGRPDSSFLSLFEQKRQGDFNYENGEGTYLVNYAGLDMGEDWVLYDMQSKKVVLQQVEAIKWATMVAIGGAVLLVLLLSNGLTNLLLRPLRRLQQLMKRVEHNDLNVRYESDYRDEVSQVGMRFNLMLEEIKKLIEQVRRGEEEKRRTEIKALSAQMEPHFLYNTLNTIHCKSLLGNIDDANEMILALASLFQLSLNQGKDILSLRDELTHVKYYLTLQQMCYEDRFDYRIEVEDESLLDYAIPKLTLQPLAENAILHGFKDIEEGGLIRIAIARFEGEQAMRVVVEDNGAGMEGAFPIKTPGGLHSGYALQNIKDRLRLFNGKEAQIHFTSKPGCGCRVEFDIALRKEDSTNDSDRSDDSIAI
ncbi:two-component system, sensor histidine kinase YesM [Cohnella sp. OV330]|uniref:cache domain-containing sensor histidine kinase n=1 Tax=Cohnella sp. OV330 TaxID=1855288 RepID=UPI0008F3B42F|nr:sensor histidine kinase [Cohnella sp. OV330]SFB07657.1 two-component system, sensor histidine kinase YesM [Cohnella sp. OV330]